jgi:hypothetical protein
MNEGWTRHDVSPFSTTLNLEIPGVKDASRPETWLERVAGRPANFVVKGARNITLLPYFEIGDEHFSSFPIVSKA